VVHGHFFAKHPDVGVSLTAEQCANSGVSS